METATIVLTREGIHGNHVWRQGEAGKIMEGHFLSLQQPACREHSHYKNNPWKNPIRYHS